MDDAVLELLSRHLDDDLDPTEARVLKERLAQDPALRRELDALAAMQRAVAEIAMKEHPPQRLDALVEPLRRGRAQKPAVRPAFRLLAAAASLVLAVVAAVHVMRDPNRRIVDESAGQRQVAAPPAPRATPYRLQPLPTVSEDEEVLSAADRILAEPIPDPPLAPPPALDVVGPLPEPANPAAEASRLEGSLAGDGEKRRRFGATAQTADPERGRHTEVGGGPMKPGEFPAGIAQPTRSARGARLTIRGPGGPVAIEVGTLSGWPAGTHTVRVGVANGRVCWIEAAPPDAGSPRQTDGTGISGRRAVSLRASGVADGEYPAELVVDQAR